MLKLRWIAFGFAVFLHSIKSYSNCEMSSFGYHSIATYRLSHDDLNSKDALLNYKIRNGKIEIDIGGGDRIYSKNFSYTSILNVNKIQVGNNICKIIEKPEILLSNIKKGATLKIPLCDKFETLGASIIEGKAFLNYSNNTLYLPKKIIAKPLMESEKELSSVIENNINDIVKTKFFRGETDLVLAPDEFKIESFEHYKFENSQLVASNVTAISTKKNDKLNVKFGLTFLSLKGLTWYIADSSYIDPCELDEDASSYMASKKKERDKIENRYIGHLAKLHTGWIFGDDEYPRLVAFDHTSNTYLMEFFKNLIVIHDENGTDSSLKEFGLQDKNPLDPKSKAK